MECALLAAEGLRTNEIAKKLGKSPITVRNQLASVFTKLGFNSRLKLIAAFASMNGKVKKPVRIRPSPARLLRG
jgi:DNA-binding CsgD family transcriptional regulator